MDLAVLTPTALVPLTGPPGGVLISFETYALVKDEVRCKEHGPVRVKGIAYPVATYHVVGPQPPSERPSTAHLRLEIDAERMSEAERKKTAEELRRALGLLEKGAQSSLSVAGQPKSDRRRSHDSRRLPEP